MKRPRNSNSLASEDKAGMHTSVGGFQSILDGLGEEDDDEMMLIMGDDAARGVGTSLSSVEKKRRLSVEQVKTLEKNFEVENKLEPERKVKLAKDLGLQPRQVAVWFQNRRARWKTKRLERDYGVLKANYDTIKNNYDKLVREKEDLLAEVKELKAKVDGESSYCSIKEEIVAHEDEYEMKVNNVDGGKLKSKINGEEFVENKEEEEEEEEEEDVPALLLYKDGSSDSDSSAILNDLSSHSGALPNQIQLQEEEHVQRQLLFTDFNYTSSSSTSSQFPQNPDGRDDGLSYYYHQPAQQHHQMLLKMEENAFLNGNEPCSTTFFSDDPSPELLSWWA